MCISYSLLVTKYFVFSHCVAAVDRATSSSIGDARDVRKACMIS